MSPAPRTTGRDKATLKKGPEGRTPRGSAAVKRALRGEAVQHEPFLAFERTNYLFMAAGVVLALIGFALLHTGDISIAPFLIVVGYCGCVPAGILWRRKAEPREPRGAATGRAGE